MKKRKTSWLNFLDARKNGDIKKCREILLTDTVDGLEMVQLGKAYTFGLYGIQKSKQEAIKCLKNSNHPLGTYYLRKYYKQEEKQEDHIFLKALDCLKKRKPHDYDRDTLVKMATSFFLKSAEKLGIYEAYHHLSQIDSKHRVKYLKLGAINGDEQCQLELAIFYEHQTNFRKAWQYMKRYWKQIPCKRVPHLIYDDIERKENTHNAVITMLLGRHKCNDGNLLWFFPKDIVRLIAKIVYNTFEERCWNNL